MILAILGTICLVIGMIICLVFGIQLIIIAFQTSVLWGLAYLFVPFANLVFVFMNWDECKSPFLKVFLAIPFFIVGLLLLPGNQLEFESYSDEFITSTDSNCKIYNPAPVEGESTTWSGSCKDGYADGQGVVKWFEGGTLIETNTGFFTKGVLNGMSYIEVPGQYIHEGYMKNDVYSGYGKRIFSPEALGINSWKQDGEGRYVGKNYVVEGIFDGNYLEIECEKSKCP